MTPMTLANGHRFDIFSPFAAFPLLYAVWFGVGSIDLLELPTSFSFGMFEPIPGYVLGYAALGLMAYLVGAGFGRPKPAGHENENQGERKHGGEEEKENRTPEFAWREDGQGAQVIVNDPFIDHDRNSGTRWSFVPHLGGGSDAGQDQPRQDQPRQDQ